MRVLLVEDEQPLAGYIAMGLRKHGFAVDVAFDGLAALEKCDVTRYDVVVLPTWPARFATPRSRSC